MPLRIAFCITGLATGGAERALCNLVRGLDPSKWQSKVFCLSSSGPLADQLEQSGISVKNLCARIRWDITVIRRRSRELRIWRPCLLQSFLFHANIAGRLAGKWAGVPVIVSGARVAERRARWPMLVDRITSCYAHHTVCVSDEVAMWMRDRAHWPESKLSVIPNAVQVKPFDEALPLSRAELGIPNDAFVVMFVGRLDLQKGLYDLIEAFESMSVRIPESHLLIVGKGPLERKLRDRILQKSFAEKIHFTGWRDDVPCLLKTADLFVLASHWEGMPNVVLEAMAAGIPVVSTDVEGIGQLVEDGVSGLVVPSRNPKAFSDAMVVLASDPARCARLSNAAYQRVAQYFSVGSMVDHYESLYERLLNQQEMEIETG